MAHGAFCAMVGSRLCPSSHGQLICEPPTTHRGHQKKRLHPRQGPEDLCCYPPSLPAPCRRDSTRVHAVQDIEHRFGTLPGRSCLGACPRRRPPQRPALASDVWQKPSFGSAFGSQMAHFLSLVRASASGKVPEVNPSSALRRTTRQADPYRRSLNNLEE